MNTPGKLHPRQDAFSIPKTGATVAATTTVVAQAYPANVAFVRIQTTNKVYVSLDSSAAFAPAASISATTGSTGRQIIVNPGQDQFFQVTGKTTASKYSVVASSGGATAKTIFHFYGTG